MVSRKGNPPQHIGVILDGNRRYAQKYLSNPLQGHVHGYEKVDQFLEWCRELGIREVTLFAFSTENFQRRKVEVDFLLGLFRKALTKLETDSRLERKDTQFTFLGRLHMFPPDIQKRMRSIMALTKDRKPFIANFAMAYGGRAEVVDATKALAAEVKNGTLRVDAIDEALFQKYLYNKSEPDLLIRPSGELRTSGFLMYAGAYAEWFFLKKLWPEIEQKDLVRILKEFAQRERRFGK